MMIMSFDNFNLYKSKWWKSDDPTRYARPSTASLEGLLGASFAQVIREKVHDAAATDYWVRPDQLYLALVELELRDSILIRL